MSSGSRTGSPVSDRAGSQRASAGPPLPRCTWGSIPCRDTARTVVRGWLLVTAVTTSSMVSPVPRMTTGWPSRTASSAPGAQGFAIHHGLSGKGTGVEGGGFPVARIAKSASMLASASSRRIGRPPVPGRRPSTSEVIWVSRAQRRRPALRVRQRVLEVAAELLPGQELQVAEPGGGRPAEQVVRVPGHPAHPGRERVQEVRRIGGRVGLAQPMPAQPVDQRDAQRILPGGGRAEQVDGGEGAAGPAADDRDHWSAPWHRAVSGEAWRPTDHRGFRVPGG